MTPLPATNPPARTPRTPRRLCGTPGPNRQLPCGIGSPADGLATPVESQRRGIRRDLAMVGAGTLVSHALGAITSLLLRALLEPRLMGIWSFLRLVLSYGSYAGLGVSKGAAREIALQHGSGAHHRADAAANLAFTVNTLTSFLYMTGVLVAAAWVTATSHGPLARYWIVGLITIGLLAVLQRYVSFAVTVLRARRRFDRTSQLTVLESCVTLAATGIGVWLFGLYGLFGGHVVVLLSSIVYLWRSREAEFSFHWDWPLARTLLATGAPILIGGAMFSLFQSVDRLMIAWYLTDPEFHLGCYSLATMVSSQLFGLGNMVGIVMYPRYQERFGRTSDPASVARLARRVMLVTAAGLGAVFGVAALAVPPILASFFPAYRPGIAAILALLPGTLCLVLSLPVTHYCVAINRQKRALLSGIGGLLLCSVGNYAVLAGGAGITGVAWATSVAYGTYFLLLVISAPGFVRYATLPNAGFTE